MSGKESYQPDLDILLVKRAVLADLESERDELLARIDALRAELDGVPAPWAGELLPDGSELVEVVDNEPSRYF